MQSKEEDNWGNQVKWAEIDWKPNLPITERRKTVANHRFWLPGWRAIASSRAINFKSKKAFQSQVGVCECVAARESSFLEGNKLGARQNVSLSIEILSPTTKTD